MNDLLAGLVGALLATNQPVAVSNLVEANFGVTLEVPDLNDPVEREFQKLLAEDDASQGEVDQWIRDHRGFVEKGAGVPEATLNDRIRKRFAPVHKGYEDFLTKHADHSRARIAYASFLGDIGDEDASRDQLEKARELDPKNPAIWNNLANYYGHRSPVAKAFEYYPKAIELDPKEPVYYQNFATTVFLFRQDAKEFYHITEQQVFDKALDLYYKARHLATNDFPLATDVAMTYYGIKPPRTQEALDAWNYALKIARDDIEREGVYIHLARIKINSGRFDEARAHLNSVTNEMYLELKRRVQRNLDEKEAESTGNNPKNNSEEKKN